MYPWRGRGLQVLLEFVDLSTGNIFVHGSERGRAEVLTFFFTEMPEAQVVLATSTGLELCSFVAKRQVRAGGQSQSGASSR